MTQPSTAHTRIHSLAGLIRQRREIGESAYVLVLGAGASLASGASSAAQIVDTVVQEHAGQDPAGLPWDERLATFYQVLDNTSAEERYLILSRHFRGAEPSPGYEHLAALVKAGYFDLILTTNFDLFLENALMDAGLRAQDFKSLINGEDQEEQIVRALRFATPRIKILKLHGDLNARIFAFTPEEIFEFADRIERTVTDILNGDIIVVGHSLRDHDLNRCIRASGGALWYVNPTEPSISDFAGQAIRARGTPEHIIGGELGRFDDFFAWLRLELLLPRITEVTDAEERRLLTELDGHRRQGELSGMAGALKALATVYARAGEKEKEQADMCYDRSVALLEGSGDLREAARVLRALGTFHAGLDRPLKAMHCYRRSRDLSRDANDPQGLAQSLALMGQCWRAVHKFEKAISYWEQALDISGGLSDPEAERVARWLREAREKLNAAEEESRNAAEEEAVVQVQPVDESGQPHDDGGQDGPSDQSVVYDTSTIRQLLGAAFDDEELKSLCFDHFREVYEAFSAGMSKNDMIQRLIEHCDRQGRFEELLHHVERLNPYQYEQFESRLYRSR